MQPFQSPRSYAAHLFADADLGDARRTKALVELFARVVTRPGPFISKIFPEGKWRERAYRFVENVAVKVDALVASVARATAALVGASTERCFVVLDGSSVSVRDPRGRKCLGAIGATSRGGRGIKVMTGLVLDHLGAPMGILGQLLWVRSPRPRETKKEKQQRRLMTPIDQKESAHWAQLVREAVKHVAVEKLWFLVDREGDAWHLLTTLMGLGARFTIRASWDRALLHEGKRTGKRTYLRNAMAKAPAKGSYQVSLPAAAGRAKRTAHMQVTARRVTLRLVDKLTNTLMPLSVNVVWAREVGTTPRDEKALDWMLLTTAPITTHDDVLQVIRSYRLRWRIEEFHKTWKSGHCRIQETMLCSPHAIGIFAVMQAAHAVRVERLKRIARMDDDPRPASEEFSDDEIDVIILLAREWVNEKPAAGGHRQMTLKAPRKAKITVREAVDWLARFGGFSRSKNGGRPGSIVLGRALLDLEFAARVLRAVRPK